MRNFNHLALVKTVHLPNILQFFCVHNYDALISFVKLRHLCCSNWLSSPYSAPNINRPFGTQNRILFINNIRIGLVWMDPDLMSGLEKSQNCELGQNEGLIRFGTLYYLFLLPIGRLRLQYVHTMKNHLCKNAHYCKIPEWFGVAMSSATPHKNSGKEVFST